MQLCAIEGRKPARGRLIVSHRRKLWYLAIAKHGAAFGQHAEWQEQREGHTQFCKILQCMPRNWSTRAAKVKLAVEGRCNGYLATCCCYSAGSPGIVIAGGKARKITSSGVTALGGQHLIFQSSPGRCGPFGVRVLVGQRAITELFCLCNIKTNSIHVRTFDYPRFA